MGRPRSEEWRVLGPYERPDGWRILTRGPASPDFPRGFQAVRFVPRSSGSAYADDLAAELRREAATRAKTVGEALDLYKAAREDRGLRSAAETARRLALWFPAKDLPLRLLSRELCRAYARDFGTRTYLPGKTAKEPRRISADYEANALIEARTFLRWCVGQGWATENPLEGVQGSKRKRRHGKPQLRVDEARRWLAAALELAAGTSRHRDGALAGLCCLILGMRSSEVTHLRVRDLDDEGTLLWVGEDEGGCKTEEARRRVHVPEVLRPLLLARTLDKRRQPRDGESWLWGSLHWRNWPRTAIRRICTQVGVPQVSAHGMRGLQASLATAAGLTAELVAAQLGHADASTTRESYASRESQTAGTQAAALRVLTGGRR